MIKLVAFDVFGTLINMQEVTHQEMKDYGTHIRQPEWSPLTLPKSWEHLYPFPDVLDGLGWLRAAGCTCVTLSNAPVEFQISLWRFNWSLGGAMLDYYVPLELARVYKPKLDAYRLLFKLFPNIAPNEMCMVSANKNFGDIEAAREVGMHSLLIRTPEIPNMKDLVNHFPK